MRAQTVSIRFVIRLTGTPRALPSLRSARRPHLTHPLALHPAPSRPQPASKTNLAAWPAATQKPKNRRSPAAANRRMSVISRRSAAARQPRAVRNRAAMVASAAQRLVNCNLREIQEFFRRPATADLTRSQTGRYGYWHGFCIYQTVQNGGLMAYMNRQAATWQQVRVLYLEGR